MFFDADPQSDTWGLIKSLATKENRCEVCFKKLQALFTEVIQARLQKQSEGQLTERKSKKDADYLQLVIENVERLPDGQLDYRFEMYYIIV
jgi:hypothetical protein